MIACVDFNLFHSEEVSLSKKKKKTKYKKGKAQIAQGWKRNKEQWKSENTVLFLSGL